MSIYISYHPLDYDFAYELLIYVRNLGFNSDLFTEKSAQKITEQDKLIAILRPEYLQSTEYTVIVGLSENISDFLAVLRVPISIEEWSASEVFRPIADFTSRDKTAIEVNLKLLQNMLLATDDALFVTTPAPRKIYLNNLDIALRTFNRPVALLERINYASDPTSELPASRLLRKLQFKIGTLNKHSEWRDSYQWNRKTFLENIVEYYKSFVVVCNDVDCLAMTCHLLEIARQHAEFDENAPIPLFLDVENWPIDVPWMDWLLGQLDFTDTPIEDIASGKCSIYAYGLDHTSFKAHPLKIGFEDWLHGPCPPRHLIVICTHLSNVDDYLLTDIIIAPVDCNISQLQEICLDYIDRPFGQFLVTANENKLSIPAFDYLLQNPVLAVALLSVKFDDEIEFKQLGVREYFQILIKNLWQIMRQRKHEDQGDFTAVESSLLRLAALATEQQKMSFSYANVLGLISPNSVVEHCIDADFLSTSNNMIRFSMPLFQEYFAAKALVQFGIPAQLPNLALDKSYQRVPQRWDKSIIIASHLSDHKDDTLKRIAKSDPLLALLCIISGVPISSTLYSFVMEQILNSLVTLGDFRVDFATHLYRIDPTAAKAILVEILRDAHWSIRLNAFTAFTELEIVFLPGLAEAITELADTTKNHVAKALHRLGVEALPTLFALLRKDSAKLRLNAVWALGELRDKASVPALIELLEDNDLEVSKQVILSLDLLQDINCVPYLVQYLNTRHIGLQKSIAIALAHLQNNMPEHFISAVGKMNATAKRSVILLFHHLTGTDIVNFLLELSYDENVDVRLAALKELGSYPEARVISRLEDCLDDMSKSRLSKSTVSDMVSKVLSNIQKADQKSSPLTEDTNTEGIVNTKSSKSSDIVKARLLQVKETRIKEQEIVDTSNNKLPVKVGNNLISQDGHTSVMADDSYVFAVLERLRERKWTSSNNAARTLREYVKGLHGTTSLNVINQILETLNDADWVIRWTGVETLGWTGNVHVVPHLVQRLTDNNWKVRIAAVRSLSEIGDNTAVAGLSALLSDNNSVVREAAAEALGLLDGKEALQALESAARDQEDFVRLAAIESLGKMHQKTTTKILLSALKDKSEHVRWAAANGLSGVANAEIVPALLPSLTDTAGPYWEQKRICDVIVDILKQIGSDEALSAVTQWGNSHT